MFVCLPAVDTPTMAICKLPVVATEGGPRDMGVPRPSRVTWASCMCSRPRPPPSYCFLLSFFFLSVLLISLPLFFLIPPLSLVPSLNSQPAQPPWPRLCLWCLRSSCVAPCPLQPGSCYGAGLLRASQVETPPPELPPGSRRGWLQLPREGLGWGRQHSLTRGGLGQAQCTPRVRFPRGH